MKQEDQTEKEHKDAKPMQEDTERRISMRWSLWARRLYREGKEPQTES